jgi:hypothetical protein
MHDLRKGSYQEFGLKINNIKQQRNGYAKDKV